MAFDGDPYRTLGLARGASLDEVKRAYRRLAKTNHPDAAGSAALPRFLAIQAAYEQLVEGSGSTNAKPRGPAGSARRASEADPGGADSTRRAYGGRARSRRTTDEPPERRRTAGGTPGTPGSGPAARERPAGAGDRGPTDPGAGRRRGKATLGSTSYDDAAAGPVEPDWSGASWYGTTSGTYWTINPKEYADPRKHGPEYQARARRTSGARPDADANAPEPVGDPSNGDAARRPVRERPESTNDPVPDPAQALANLARFLADPRTSGLRGRVIRAVLGWLPIGLGIGWLLGELTGCGRFAATCDPSVNPLILLIQGAALVVLLLLPLAASLAASAALGLVVAAVVATLILSATGAAADEGSRHATLGLLLLVAWLAGLGIAIVRRVRSASSRAGPVS
jgi:hypothetical protein